MKTERTVEGETPQSDNNNKRNADIYNARADRFPCIRSIIVFLGSLCPPRKRKLKIRQITRAYTLPFGLFLAPKRPRHYISVSGELNSVFQTFIEVFISLGTWLSPRRSPPLLRSELKEWISRGRRASRVLGGYTQGPGQNVTVISNKFRQN